MAKYLLDNIHAQFPEAKLAVVVSGRGGMIRDLLSSSPYIEVIETNRRDVRGLWRLWKAFHGSDLVVTQYAGKPGGRFSLASKFAARLLARRGGLLGFQDVSPWNKFLYNHLLPVRPDLAVALHEREALRAASLEVVVPYPHMALTEDKSVPWRFGLRAREYVIVHFFAGNAGRSISPEKARSLVLELQKHLPGRVIAVSGGAADKETATRIVEGLPDVAVLAGEASLQDMMQLIVQSIGVVSVDTGIAHITAQLGSPLIVMRTCLGPNWWFVGQYGEGVPAAQFSQERLCESGHVKKDYPDCIEQIDEVKVADSAQVLFHE